MTTASEIQAVIRAVETGKNMRQALKILTGAGDSIHRRDLRKILEADFITAFGGCCVSDAIAAAKKAAA